MHTKYYSAKADKTLHTWQQEISNHKQKTRLSIEITKNVIHTYVYCLTEEKRHKVKWRKTHTRGAISKMTR